MALVTIITWKVWGPNICKGYLEQLLSQDTLTTNKGGLAIEMSSASQSTQYMD